VKRYAHLSGGHLRAAEEGMATFGKVLQKDAPTDVEEIQRKEGQSKDPVHISVSVPLESQLRHEKAEKVNSESATFSNATVTGTGIQDTEGARNTSEVVEVVGGPGEN
jgi:hypothetical protein